ncbi:MAG: LytTR family DNA-binding domain-containing protein [Bacteroidales bacterium]|jgi:two-component system LytT family response regulator|nr:LytTR family DNA-binding domain-containing protein [Bacteroidales bacterium]
MIRTLIIDDEIRARETIQTLLEIYCKDDVQVVGQAKNMRKGIDAIKELKPDLVLLDIKMPDGSGFDLLARYGKIDFKVIFITAFEEYAIRAFKFSAIDYLLKPIDPDELKSAINKIKNLVITDLTNDMDIKFEAFLSNMRNHNEAYKKLVLRTTENIFVIDINEVVALSSDRNYTRFYFLEREPIIVSKTLKDFENILDEFGFMRIHRSHIINLKYIERYEKMDGGFAIMRGNIKFDVSHRRKEDLLAFFDQL